MLQRIPNLGYRIWGIPSMRRRPYGHLMGKRKFRPTGSRHSRNESGTRLTSARPAVFSRQTQPWTAPLSCSRSGRESRAENETQNQKRLRPKQQESGRNRTDHPETPRQTPSDGKEHRKKTDEHHRQCLRLRRGSHGCFPAEVRDSSRCLQY